MQRRPDVYLEFALLAHGYTTLDHRRVYDAATVKAPALTATLEALLTEFPE